MLYFNIISTISVAKYCLQQVKLTRNYKEI
jgi:hypothetical protein